jgi:hypothetical protein
MATKKRLIDANALYAKLGKMAREPYYQHDGDDYYVGMADASMEVHCAPTVDAVEVVYGRWKYYHKQNIAVCTNCSFERDLDANFGKAISCPNCGAKMGEVTDES